MRPRVSAAILLALGLGGCAGWRGTPLSALDPAGPGAAPTAALWWVMLWASLAITALMVALSLYAVLRNAPTGAGVPSRLLIAGGGVAFPLGAVTALLVYGLPAGQAMLASPDDPDAFRVDVHARQWWWQVRYPQAQGGPLFDANELHIPAGRPVHVRLTAGDVIHSFWAPRLGGKLDAVPGLANVLRIAADRPGVYRGQCAEFCGEQHARMGFHVEAHDEEALRGRLARLAAPPAAAPPAAFRAHCANCHSADSRAEAFASPALIGPNLAGVAGRRFLGAGWLPNGEGALVRWIREHQAIKPRNFMPSMAHLDDATVAAIAAYLEQRR